jgi:hypothetical protein
MLLFEKLAEEGMLNALDQAFGIENVEYGEGIADLPNAKLTDVVASVRVKDGASDEPRSLSADETAELLEHIYEYANSPHRECFTAELFISAIGQPLIVGLSTPYGPADEGDALAVEHMVAGMKQMVEGEELSEELSSELIDHCLAFEPCHGSIITDPRVLFHYLRLAWRLNDGEDLRKIVELLDRDMKRE